MTFEESTKVLYAIRAAYPNAFKDMTADDAKNTASVWASILAHRSGEEVLNAVKSFILTDTKGFVPSIGQINALIAKGSENANMSELEAWSIVRKAIRNSAWESEKEFAALPDIIQKTIGSPASLKEWALMPMEQVDSVVSSNFQRSFRAKQKNAEFEAKLPPELIKKLGDNQCKMLS